jgi:hypothetical protein
VRVFKHEGGPVDDDFELVDEDNLIYFRPSDGRFYLFCKIRGVLHFFGSSGAPHPFGRLKCKLKELRVRFNDLTVCTVGAFYVQGGSVDVSIGSIV